MSDPIGTESTIGTAGTDAARQRLAAAQHAVLSALVTGTPVPDGFDHRRLEVQRRALLAKRADVAAKVAPELADLLAGDFRALFLSYARTHAMAGGYRQDTLDFARHLLDDDTLAAGERRRQLSAWLAGHAAPASPGAFGRLAAALRGRRPARTRKGT
ncbi:hypothetical protein GCM10009544_54060 [Streptomyces stramineus]|uniref:SCO6045-like C-terminal domain-containing protein n=1 Tax=Streptomyces stramineus TaxID=173861 RepID=A0ABN1AXL8_9ACTN